MSCWRRGVAIETRDGIEGLGRRRVVSVDWYEEAVERVAMLMRW